MEIKSIIESRIDFHQDHARDEFEDKTSTQNMKKNECQKVKQHLT
jgi:hypothetical protein